MIGFTGKDGLVLPLCLLDKLRVSRVSCQDELDQLAEYI